ncbi:putative ankyrin repeat [Lyophyllum shimeji]|uniref:Ankyrin repeat n=1 Tax=Lyophyllum shimeji TaxID=47721 RepID=A0A9P3UW92_LYOSH|nr:putative ankyrin repeat [Lyophyllum shimeji]
MEYPQHSFDQFGLHSAATAGDDEAVARALQYGADVNGLDAAGRTALMCAVAGEHWQNIDASDASFMTPRRLNTIRLLLKHPQISLFTLNAPQSSMNGVIPLGMAAWLNMEEAVRILLEDSADTVSVDGMDAHGATALMYAARDGSLRVVQLLLSHGARPDFRDCNHRTSIQFALDHPQILWLCESILRRHRWRESQSADRNKLFAGSEELLELAYSAMPSDSLEPPPLSIFTGQANSRLTDTLISSIAASDLSFLHSLLFSPALPSSSPPALYPMSAPLLVNRPDANGWSPIHHCVAAMHPCIDILDALYCAGAEVALFTTHEHYTPLHILAKSRRLSPENKEHAVALYHFIVHLIRDLRAPLSARDKNDETCIHLAAEHGNCINLLTVLLEFDTTGSVRELRNARGLTALEVCKPEFRAAFGENAEKFRSMSSMSMRTIRPSGSFASLVSFSELQAAGADDALSLCAPLDLDIEESTQQLLFNLRATSLSIHHSRDPVNLSRLSNLLAEVTHLNQGILRQLRSRVQEASKELQELRSNSDKVQLLLDHVTQAAITKLGDKGFDAFRRRRARDSEDSQMTVFHQPSRSTSTMSISRTNQVDENHVSVAAQTVPLVPRSSTPSKSSGRPATWSEWFEALVSSDAPTYTDRLADLTEVERALIVHRRKMEEEGAEWNEFASPGMDEKLKRLEKKYRKLEDKIRAIESCDPRPEPRDSGSPKKGKLRNWIKRIIAPEKTPLAKIQIVLDIDEQGCAVGRQVKSEEDLSEADARCPEDPAFDVRIEAALATSHIVLNASKRDLYTIEQCLASAEQFLQLANHSISRADRVIKRAVKKRETMIAELRAAPPSDGRNTPTGREKSTRGGLGYSLLSLRPSIASLSSVNSAHSSCPSVAPTVTENDDDDTRAIRRLLLRKIEAGIVGSWDEMDKVLSWQRIVKEAARGVKRRAYL